MMEAIDTPDLPERSLDHGDEELLTVSQAARTAGVSRSTLYRAIRLGKLQAINLENGGRRLQLAEILAIYGDNQPEPVGDDPEPDEIPGSADADRISQLEEELRAEQAKVALLEDQLAAVEHPADVQQPKSRRYSSSRRRWKLIRTWGQTFDKFVGGTAIVVIVLVLIIALIFAFGGFSELPDVSEF